MISTKRKCKLLNMRGKPVMDEYPSLSFSSFIFSSFDSYMYFVSCCPPFNEGEEVTLGDYLIEVM